MPENTIAQNLPIFYACQATQLKTHSGATIATQSNHVVPPPSTTSLLDDPTELVQETVMGAPHY